MRRWRFDSIAMTIGLTIAVAMGLGFTLEQLINSEVARGGLSGWRNTRFYDMRFYAALLPVSVASLVGQLEAIPAEGQAAAISASQRPNIRIDLLDAPLPHLANTTELEPLVLRRSIQLLFKSPHVVIVAPRTPQNDSLGSHDDLNGKKDDWTDGSEAPGANGMLIEVQLTNGHWLLFKTNVPTPKNDPVANAHSQVAFGAWLGLAAILVLLLSVLAAQRLASPLSQLALGVEQLGASGDTVLVVPKGPREVRVAINAFNRMQERLKRFNDDRVQMLAAMSHDLRTSLTRLKLRLELDDRQEQKQRMLAELDAMNAMIGSILSFARDDTKGEPRTLVDLDALVEGICEDASDAGATVTYAGARGASVSGRPAALRRAFSNLVENAVKYGLGAEVTLTVEANRIVVAVEDRGPGIPRGEREKVFEPFYRPESSRSSDTGGVGLGLSVARSIAREHGGDVVLAGRKGGGLSARLELPA